MQIKIKKLHPKVNLPRYAHGPECDAGMDIESWESGVLQPGDIKLFATGLSVEIPPGNEMQIRPRSGLAIKHGVTVINAPGTVDPSYRGELKVGLVNLGRNPYMIHAGDRIAQIVISRYEAVDWEESDLADSVRGSGGFGSSGIR
jgi:dUTP pyrophosphatase